MSQSFGISRSKTSLLEELRRQKFQKNTRFKKKKAQSGYTATSTLLGETVELSTSLSFDSEETPEFIRIFEGASKKLEELEFICSELNKETATKLKNQFSTAVTNDEKIHDLTDKAVSIVYEGEKALKKISAMKVKEADEPVKKNIQRSLAKKVQEAAKKIRVEEHNLYHSMQKLKGNGGQFDSILNDDGVRRETVEDEEGNTYEMEILERVSQEREEEINHVVKAIHDLASLFKSMNEIIIEQGTILDQIDHNIQEARTQINSGNKHLLKVLIPSLHSSSNRVPLGENRQENIRTRASRPN